MKSTRKPQKPIRVSPTRRERFRRAVAGLQRDTLLRNVDLFLQQMDDAKAGGDGKALAWAEARWNIVWVELDRRDGVPGSESAS